MAQQTSQLEFGVYGRVLFCGQLEKRRDGAVRAGWASRLFLLTPDALHYFRKATDLELLGEERGHLPLSAIRSVRAMPEDEAPYASVELGAEHYYLEIATESRAFLMRAPVSEASTCESWSIAIEEQRKALRAKQSDQRECPPSSSSSALSAPAGTRGAVAEALPSPTLLARNHELFSLFEASPPRVAMVSVVRVGERDGRPAEHVVKRRVAWNETVALGVVPQGSACVILLQGGGLARVGTQALMGTWDAGRPCWVEAADADAPTEIEVSVTCKVLPSAAASDKSSKSSSSSSNNNAQPMRAALPKWLDWADEGSSVGFLLMCLFVHLLYGVEGFHWTHKCCLTVGAALAISTILNGSAARGSSSSGSSSGGAPVSSPTPRHHTNPTTLLPTLQFALTVHRCRIKMEGTEFVYPTPVAAPATGSSPTKGSK